MAICIACYGDFHPNYISIDGLCIDCRRNQQLKKEATERQQKEACDLWLCPECRVPLDVVTEQYEVRGSVLPYPGCPPPTCYAVTQIRKATCPSCGQDVPPWKLKIS